MDDFKHILIPRKDIDPDVFANLNKIICNNVAKSFIFNIDYMCQRIIDKANNDKLDFDDMVSALEVIELSGLYCEQNAKDMVRKHVMDE